MGADVGDQRYIQREISWNAFNARVLNEGMRPDNRLLDRLKFMAITSSNYDEFFMVRVARLMRDALEGDFPIPPTGKRSSEVLTRLLSEIRTVVDKQDQSITRDIFPALAENGITILGPEEWDSEANLKADAIFENELFPVSTPIAVLEDTKLNELVTQTRIYVAYLMEGDDLAIVRLPDNIDRFREIHISKKKREIVLLDDILLTRGRQFFPGRQLKSACFFRITRDADMTVNEERDEDFIAAMEEVLESRKTSFPVRLETRGDIGLANDLRSRLDLPEANHFHLTAPLELKAFMKMAFMPGYEKLRAPTPKPSMPEDLSDNDDIWDVLKERDVLLHHPYESYSPVIRLVEEASEDPKTLAIKMTVYRTSGNSPIIKALIKAAERGVQVTVLVELKARFDEGANITWAARLEKAGAIVIYGLAILKVHAKAMMIIRREDEGIRRYLHMGTGNYNDTTAKIYTDMGMITSRDDYTHDAALMFNAITGYSSEPHLETLYMAPFSLRRETLRLIHREQERAKGGEEARIIAKMNSLVDPEIIEALYEASIAGVKIDLNVRGICCLKPGKKGISDNIRVVSIIDSFLEHTRAFLYYNGGRTEVYLSSADWMARNLDRRIELLFSLPDSGHKSRVRTILESYFRDNCRSWYLNSDGDWKPSEPGPGEKPFRVQESLSDTAAAYAASRESEEKKVLTVRRKLPGMG